jgi:UDP-N-acetylmuramyl tripeptide synthase
MAVVELDRRAGHENYQILGGQKHHFDDVEEAIAAIRGNPLAA